MDSSVNKVPKWDLISGRG